jgi:hypothetical protein
MSKSSLPRKCQNQENLMATTGSGEETVKARTRWPRSCKQENLGCIPTSRLGWSVRIRRTLTMPFTVRVMLHGSAIPVAAYRARRPVRRQVCNCNGFGSTWSALKAHRTPAAPRVGNGLISLLLSLGVGISECQSFAFRISVSILSRS